jgi:hypothetical protein
MIQRIQTIFLLFAGGAFASLLAFPFATNAVTSQGIFQDGKYSIFDHVSLQVLAIAGSMLALICIFMFKKRSVQITLGYLLILVGIVLLGVVILYFMNQVGSILSHQIQIGLFMPVAAIILAIIANYFIRKDERLVQSMDRLR